MVRKLAQPAKPVRQEWAAAAADIAAHGDDKPVMGEFDNEVDEENDGLPMEVSKPKATTRAAIKAAKRGKASDVNLEDL